MGDTLLIYCIICLCSVVLGSTEDGSDEVSTDEGNAIDKYYLTTKVMSECWMTLNAQQHFKVMDEIDDRYAKIREEVQESLMESDFDKSMVNEFVQAKGVAFRHVYAHLHDPSMIPSGMNLGGFCMLRMNDSELFFHRMKLRNNTYFRIDYLHNDLANMMVRINLSLNDLHLKGAYERSLTDKNPAVLIYAPTFGQVEFLLKDVKYKMEGRYRLIKGSLLIKLVSSEIIVDDILMTYINQTIESSSIKVEKENLGCFMDRLKTDLNKWIKDYFNDYMIYAKMDGIPHMDELSKYDKEKGIALEEFMDNAVDVIATRLRLLKAETIRLPEFTFKAIHGLEIKLYDGILHGLDSMYRRSVATEVKESHVRKVDAIVGFSNLKVVYKYDAMIPTGVPPLAGVLTLSANELTAHLALAVVANPETIDLNIEFLEQMKPESLTVEGAANIMISNYKHLLEHQIVTIMSNTLIHGISTLKSLSRCEPFIPELLPEMKIEPQTNETDFSNWNISEAEVNYENEFVSKDEKTRREEYKASLRSTKKTPTTYLTSLI